MKICFYLSDHGYGHMARNIPIIEYLAEKAGIAIIAVCNKGQVEFAKQNISKEAMPYISFRIMHTDVGLILQKGTLLIDKVVLETACQTYLHELPRKAEQESKWLLENQMDKVVCDMPLWAMEACKLANIPLLFSSNFTWAEQYKEHLSENVYNRYIAEYNKIENAVYLALSNDEMKKHLPNGEVISVFARRFNEQRAEQIKAKHKRPIIFIALGMSASFDEAIDVGGIPYDIITTQGIPLKGDNVTTLPLDVPDTHNFILASDYVITKAGWGTVAEALLARKKIALFSRDSVFEDRTTIGILKAQDLAISIKVQDLYQIEYIIHKMNNMSNRNFSLYTDDTQKIANIILGF